MAWVRHARSWAAETSAQPWPEFLPGLSFARLRRRVLHRSQEKRTMSEFVFINRLQPKEVQRGQLIDLLREFATVIHKEPGGVHYSLHQPIDDETGPLTVIQVFSSLAAFEEHGAWMGPN